MDQPVAKISYDDILRIVKRDYPAESEKETLEILRHYKSNNDKSDYRVWASLLKISEGNIEKLRININVAKNDFRDIVANAEYPEYTEKIGFDNGKFTREEIKRIIQSDWKQYQVWLKA